MNHTINNNGIQQGFANLAQILAPNANSMIAADTARQRNEQARLRTGVMQQNAATAATNARVSAGKAAREKAVHENLMALGTVLPGLDVTTPEGRAGLIGVLGAAGIDLTDPKLATGFATLINPQMVGQTDLANIFLGTGVVDDYGKTAPGHAATITGENDRHTATLRNNVDVANVEAAATRYGHDMGYKQGVGVAGINAKSATDVASIDADSALAIQEAEAVAAQVLQTLMTQGDVEVADINATSASNVAGINAKSATDVAAIEATAPRNKGDAFKVAPLDEARALESVSALIQENTGVTPGADVVNAVMAKAGELYAKSGNWPGAVQTAMTQFSFSTGGVNNPFVTNTVTATPAQPAAAFDPSQATATATGPAGQKIYAIGGKWFDENGAPVQ